MAFYFLLHDENKDLGWQATTVGWPTAGVGNGAAGGIQSLGH